MSSQQYVKADLPLCYEVTDKGPYSPAQKRVRYQVSPSFASAIPTDCRPGPRPIGYHSEGSLNAANLVHRWTGEYLINK